MLGQRLAAPTRATHLMAAVHGPMGTVLQLAQPEMQRAPRYPRGPGDQGRPAVAKRFGFGGDPEATSPFVHHRCQSEKLFPNDCFHGCLVHGEILEHFTVLYELFMDSYLGTAKGQNSHESLLNLTCSIFDASPKLPVYWYLISRQ